MPFVFTAKRAAYAPIEERFRCSHPVRELRLRLIADGRPIYYRQCLGCGAAGQAQSAKLAKAEFLEGKSAPPYDEDLEPKWHARKHAEYLKAYLEVKPHLNAEYESYLKSQDWQGVRTRALVRASDVCQCCNHFPATQVHHITYARIGSELDEDLMAVCAFCHDLLHAKAA